MPAAVLTLVGNRPQFVKAAAVSRHLRERAEEVLVHSGQHYDRELSEIFFEELGLPAPAHTLGAGSGSHAEQTAAILTALEPLVESVGPDAILIYGDTNTTLAGALVGAKQLVPVAHVEAGMRSFDRAMPEEVNRVVADRLSGLLLCSTPTAVENLRREGLGDGVRLVGDVMADVSLTFGPIADRRSDALERLGLQPGSYILATAHRAGNVDDPEDLRRLAGVLERAARIAPVVMPLHPRTRARLEALGADGALDARGVAVVDSLGYLDFTRLLRAARAVLTDSGGVQKEAFLASVPCVTMREATEWVETVEAGWNRLVGLDAGAAAGALEDLAELRGERADASIYGGGEAGARVAGELAAWLTSGG
jgi:UDP-N-acetylglucosamine 2-epimerase (non-hydrolysing)/UDP-GlcNAc3NAcA epimerase